MALLSGSIISLDNKLTGLDNRLVAMAAEVTELQSATGRWDASPLLTAGERGGGRETSRSISRTIALREEVGQVVSSHARPPSATDGEAANPGPRLRHRSQCSTEARDRRRQRRHGERPETLNMEELFATKLTLHLINIRSP